MIHDVDGFRLRFTGPQHVESLPRQWPTNGGRRNMEAKAALLHHLKTFNALIDLMIGLQIDCRTGFKHNKSVMEKAQVRAHALAKLRKDNKPPPTIEEMDRAQAFFARTAPTVPDARYLHRTTQGEFKSRNSENGVNTILMDRSIIVTMYSFWEEHFRPTIAAAANLTKDEIKLDIFGDLRILRHCIIHRIGKCDVEIKKTKILKWFSERGEIILTEQMMDEIFTEVKKGITLLPKELAGEDVVYHYERPLQPASSVRS